MKKQPIDWLNPNVILSYPIAFVLVMIEHLKYYWRR